MLYYHIFLIFTDKNGTRRKSASYGCSPEFAENLATSYMKNKPFLFNGRFVYPNNVDLIEIFESDEREGKKLILPNGNNAMDEEDGDYVLRCFSRMEVKNVRGATEKFITSPPEEKTAQSIIKQSGEKTKIFIVHGRDEKQALLLQKYLRDKMKKNAIIFDDLPDKGRTIIEQLEYIRMNVYHAFVIVTPDDLGCLREKISKLTSSLISKKATNEKKINAFLESLHKRARQNVVFELGLFIGALGREKVCCLLHHEIDEKPSDILGILYKPFRKSVKEIFHEIAAELKND